MPSTRTLGRGVGGLVALATVGTAAAQTPGSELGLGTRVGIRFGVVLVLNLLTGGALVAVGPRYAASKVGEIRDDPVGAFGWGLLVGIGVPVALGLLALTVVGLVVAVPGLLLLFPLGVVGSAVAAVAVGATVTSERGTPGATAVVVGAVTLAVVAAVPLVGQFATQLVNFLGIGVVGRGVYQSWRD